jgi:hypothetical protein
VTGSPLRGHVRDPRGQSLVEFAILIPFLMLLILGAIEFGFAFGHHLTLEYATREGARVGASLAAGSDAVDCDDVDAYIVAAVARVLASSGSPVDVSEVRQIRIFRADSAGGETPGQVNLWTYAPGAGPAVDGVALDFAPPASPAWSACARVNSQPADSIGVSLDYTYRVQTPFLSLMGVNVLPMGDRTVMALNPSE